MKKEVEFYSDGALVKGHLYLPENIENDKEYATILLCHGFAGVKEMLLPDYATDFARNGFIALTFDYRGFGESEGEKGKLSKTNQVADIRNAITYLQTLNEVDNNKIGLWGTSYGGANAIEVAAIDKRVKCLCAQLAFGNGERVILGDKSDEEQQKIIQSIEKMWTRKVTQNKNIEMSVDRFLTDEQSIQFYNENVDKFPQLKTRIPFLTMKETMEHKPEDYISKIQIPVLLIGAENDLVNPVKETKILFEKANEPKLIHVVENATHYEVYEGEKFNEVIEIQKNWFNLHLN